MLFRRVSASRDKCHKCKAEERVLFQSNSNYLHKENHNLLRHRMTMLLIYVETACNIIDTNFRRSILSPSSGPTWRESLCFCWKNCIYLRIYTVSKPRTVSYSSPLWEPEFSLKTRGSNLCSHFLSAHRFPSSQVHFIVRESLDNLLFVKLINKTVVPFGHCKERIG
jgi:hypothetical protein